jgi:hypothetical protein
MRNVKLVRLVSLVMFGCLMILLSSNATVLAEKQKTLPDRVLLDRTCFEVNCQGTGPGFVYNTSEDVEKCRFDKSTRNIKICYFGGPGCDRVQYSDGTFAEEYCTGLGEDQFGRDVQCENYYKKCDLR